MLNLAARTVPVDAAPVDAPRSSSIFGEAKPVDIKDKMVDKPKPKSKPRVDKADRDKVDRGRGNSKDKEQKPQRSDGAWTKEKALQGDKKILQREQGKTKGMGAEKNNVSVRVFP